MRTGPRGALLLIALLLAACAPGAPVAPAPTEATPTASAEPTATVAVNPPTPTPSTPPMATPAGVALLDGQLRSLTSSWRPRGETLVLQTPAGIDGSILTALPLDGSPAVPLVAFGPSVGWDIRPDGSAIALSLITGQVSSRIAVWDARAGAARWVTSNESGVLHETPVWSADGSAIFYSGLRAPDDLGIFRVSAAGGASIRVRAPEGNGVRLEGVTPDGRGLVLSRNQAGGSAHVFDLGTRETRGFDEGNSQAVSWRKEQPRALVISGFCCAGGPRGTLAVWDDRSGERRLIYGSDLTPQEAVGTAAWDPEGRRIVAVVHDRTTSSTGPLMTMNEMGTERTTIAGTQGAGDVRWLRAGIVYVKGTADGGAELWLVPSGGSPARIFTGSYLAAWKTVTP